MQAEAEDGGPKRHGGMRKHDEYRQSERSEKAMGAVEEEMEGEGGEAKSIMRVVMTTVIMTAMLICMVLL